MVVFMEYDTFLKYSLNNYLKYLLNTTYTLHFNNLFEIIMESFDKGEIVFHDTFESTNDNYPFYESISNGMNKTIGPHLHHLKKFQFI